jgi:hypothetical protein
VVLLYHDCLWLIKLPEATLITEVTLDPTVVVCTKQLHPSGSNHLIKQILGLVSPGCTVTD